MSDNLTIAYLAIGALTAQDSKPLPDDIADKYGGQIGYIDAVIRWAPMLDELGDAVGDALDGVFAYEVAEVFGRRAGLAIMDRRPWTQAEAEAVGRELVDSITIKEKVSALEQAFQRYENAMTEHAHAQEAKNDAIGACSKASDESIAARTALWKEMVKDRTYVRSEAAFTAYGGNVGSVTVTPLAKP